MKKDTVLNASWCGKLYLGLSLHPFALKGLILNTLLPHDSAPVKVLYHFSLPQQLNI